MNESSAPGPSPERNVPVMPTPEVQGLSPEVAPEQGPAPQEVLPQSGEGANQNAGMVLPTVATSTPISQQPLPNPVPLGGQGSGSATNSPATASDVDLIEKEWVNKAKTIIGQTKNDPHLQELEVSKLQIDYLKKRYGKEIRPSGD